MAITTEDELIKKITNGLITAVEYTVNRFGEYNEESINKVVYSSYSPSWYERTMDFLNAWDTTASGGGGHAEGEMYFEPSSIGVGDMEGGQHVSIIDGSSQAQNMPELLYQSGMGCIDRPTHRDAWDDLDGILTNRTVRQIFEAGLGASGLPWKRKTGAITVTKTR